MTTRKNSTIVTMTQAELDGGAGTALSGERIVIVDAAGIATGVIYDSGAAGSPAQQIATTATVASAVAAITIKDWQAATAVLLNEVRRATATVGTIELGDLIRSNSARTTGATFDVTEAGNWTEFAPDLVTSVAGRTGAVVLTKADTGLGNVDNTADTAKPVSTATQTALDAKAPTASPALTGIPTVPTAAVDTNTTQAASTAFVNAQLSGTLPLMDGTATVGTGTRSARGNHVHPTDTSRAPVASPTFTGTPAGPTAVTGTNTTQLASTAFVKAAVDTAVVGLLDYRGAFTPAVSSGASGYPTTGGSGVASAIVKGDMFVASAAGFILTEAIQIGDAVIAKIDTPGQTATNWDKLNANVSYVPENQASKVTSLSGASTDTQYPSAKLAFDQLALKAPLASPAFTGTPTIPTAVAGTNTTQAASTAFVKAAVDVGSVLIGATANPVTTTQGYVNTSTPVFTGKLLGTAKIWRMDVRGWFPNATANVQNVNGVTQAFLRNIGTGELINTGGWVNRSGANQHHLIKDIPNAGGHISAFYLYDTNTASHILALYNTHSGADFNGMEFQGFCEFTDSNLV